MMPDKIAPSGGALTTWEEIDIVCLCGEHVFAFGDSDDTGSEIVTCAKCGQQFKVTCNVEVVDALK